MTNAFAAALSQLVSNLNERTDYAYRQACHKNAERSQSNPAHEFPWAIGLTVEQVAERLYLINKPSYTFTIKDKRKYVNIDVEQGSGRFVMDKMTGNIYGIKGYGVVHHGYFYGNVTDSDTIERMFNSFHIW